MDQQGLTGRWWWWGRMQSWILEPHQSPLLGDDHQHFLWVSESLSRRARPETVLKSRWKLAILWISWFSVEGPSPTLGWSWNQDYLPALHPHWGQLRIQHNSAKSTIWLNPNTQYPHYSIQHSVIQHNEPNDQDWSRCVCACTCVCVRAHAREWTFS